MFSHITLPPIFLCFIIFSAWFFYESRKAAKKSQKKSDAFWAREEEANHARNRDISNLPMVTVERGQIPMPETSDENTLFYQKQVTASLDFPMMNLSGYTNTDLKLAYGAGNFKTLSDYDENFNNFLMNLSHLAKAYSQTGFSQEAIVCYQLALKIGSDKTTDFKALAKLYVDTGERSKIQELCHMAETSGHPRKEALRKELETMMAK